MAKSVLTLQQKLHQLISRDDYTPLKQHELARCLDLDGPARKSLRAALREMEQTGTIVRLRKNRYALPDDQHTVIGVISLHPEGYGFVTPVKQPRQEDIFVPARMRGAALHGDTVQLAISTRNGRRRGRGSRPGDDDPRTSGRVIRVVERKMRKTAGRLKVTPQYRYVIPDHPRMTANIHVDSASKETRSAKDNHRVVIELLPWDDPSTPIKGRLIEDLGPADKPGADILALIHSHQLAPEFPKQVETSSRRERAGTSRHTDERRQDLRDECAITIDPPDARDFDDAVALRALANGDWELSVHIADVDAYVAPDSVIDREALARGTSVYLVDRVITMLPRSLTEEVCSLAPDQDRLAHTVRMRLDQTGQLLDTQTFPSLIRSSQRLDYDQVQAFLAGTAPAPQWPEPIPTMLRHMQVLAEQLRAHRAEAGSVLFEMPEVRCVLDAQGVPTDLVPRTAYTAYHLIEEFMLMANQAVARIIAAHDYPCLYRIHEAPDDGQWEQMSAALGALGYALPEVSRTAMNEVAASVADTPLAHIVNLAMLRNLKQARYAAERGDHFGLAFSHYLHFTSPIRRFPDLVAHRVLKAIERKAPPPYSAAELAELAAHCSLREREAAEAEMESVDLKRMEYYAAQLEAGRTGPYPALVTAITGRGLLVELADTLQRGMIPFAWLDHDYYQPDAHNIRAVGRRSRHTWQIGQRLDVEMVRVDTQRKRIDFRPTNGTPKAAPRKQTSRKRRGTSGRKRARR